MGRPKRKWFTNLSYYEWEWIHLGKQDKRDIISHLPPNISEVVINMGYLKDRIINEDHKALLEEKYYQTDMSLPGFGYGR